MRLKAQSRLRTFDDFCALVKDGQKADLMDGVICMASPDSLETNNLFVWFIGLLDFIEERELGELFGSAHPAIQIMPHEIPSLPPPAS
jgi:hypothetical protein